MIDDDSETRRKRLNLEMSDSVRAVQVDAFGFDVSSRVQLGGALTMRHRDTKILVLFLIYFII